MITESKTITKKYPRPTPWPVTLAIDLYLISNICLLIYNFTRPEISPHLALMLTLLILYPTLVITWGLYTGRKWILHLVVFGQIITLTHLILFWKILSLASNHIIIKLLLNLSYLLVIIPLYFNENRVWFNECRSIRKKIPTSIRINPAYFLIPLTLIWIFSIYVLLTS